MEANYKLKQIRGISNDVFRLLEKHNDLKDNDFRLTANIWNEQLRRKGYDTSKMNVSEFLQLYANEKITQADVITRARRKLQETFVHLRGKNWEKRQKFNNEVREQINK